MLRALRLVLALLQGPVVPVKWYVQKKAARGYAIFSCDTFGCFRRFDIVWILNSQTSDRSYNKESRIPSALDSDSLPKPAFRPSKSLIICRPSCPIVHYRLLTEALSAGGRSGSGSSSEPTYRAHLPSPLTEPTYRMPLESTRPDWSHISLEE